ncbi:MAG: hypothetical protein ACK55I_48180, partial [bacterium]
LAPGHDLVVAPNHPEGGDRRRLAVHRDLAGAVKEKALRDKVRVVVDQGLLDQLVEGVEREPHGSLATGELGEVTGHLTADLGHPKPVLLGEDLLFPARQMHVGQRLAEGVRHLRKDETLLPVGTQQDDLGHRDALPRDDVTPG